MPGISFVIAEGFFFAMLFVLASHGWSLAMEAAGVGVSKATVLWHLFRFEKGEWLAFIAAAALIRWTLLAKLRLPSSKASGGLFRAAAVLFGLQVGVLLLVGPIFSIILTPLTLGSGFVLTLIANIRAIVWAVKR